MAPPRVLIVPGSCGAGRDRPGGRRRHTDRSGAVRDAALSRRSGGAGGCSGSHPAPAGSDRGARRAVDRKPRVQRVDDAVLVNTLDWCSRVDRANPTRSGLAIFADKPAALVGSSPGAFGGLRALIHLRDLLGYLGMVVIPQQVVIPRAHQAFDPDGGLVDPTQRAALEAVAAALVRAAA